MRLVPILHIKPFWRRYSRWNSFKLIKISNYTHNKISKFKWNLQTFTRKIFFDWIHLLIYPLSVASLVYAANKLSSFSSYIFYYWRFSQISLPFCSLLLLEMLFTYSFNGFLSTSSSSKKSFFLGFSILTTVVKQNFKLNKSARTCCWFHFVWWWIKVLQLNDAFMLCLSSSPQDMYFTGKSNFRKEHWVWFNWKNLEVVLDDPLLKFEIRVCKKGVDFSILRDVTLMLC